MSLIKHTELSADIFNETGSDDIIGYYVAVVFLFDVGRSMLDVGRSSFEEFNAMCKCS